MMLKRLNLVLPVLLVGTLLSCGVSKTSVPSKKERQDKAVSPIRNNSLSESDRKRYDYFFLEAMRQQNAEHYDAAFDLLSRCIEIDSLAAEAYFMQSRYLLQMRKDSLALSYLEKASWLRPDNGYYQERLAQSYIAMGNYDKASEAFERLYAVNRDRSDVLNILVQLYKQQKKYDKMLNAINRIEQIEGEDEQFALARMSVYELMGDKKNAYLTLKQMAESHPNDVNYSIMLGNWLMQNKKQNDAYKLFEEALKVEPDNTFGQSSMYDYYRASGQTDLANQMMRRILLSKTTPVENRTQFLRQAIQENEQQGGDSTKIISLLEQMRNQLPKDASVAEMKVAYYSMKKMPEADINKALVDLLALAPDNGGARYQLIQNKWPKNNWKEIAELSEPGMLYNPDEMAFYYFTGLSRFYQNDDKGALDAFQRGTSVINSKSNPEIVSDFYAIMGDIYHSNGQKEKAYAAYDSCLQWKPDHAMALNNYAYYLSEDGKELKRAEEMSAKAVKLKPKDGTLLDTYAWILYQQERYVEARIYIDQALANMEDSTVNSVVLEHAGDIYDKAGQKDKAVEYWQKAIDAGGDKLALNRKIKLYRKRK